MNRLHCGPLAAWSTAWLNGTAAFDDVLTAASARAPAMANAVPMAGGASPAAGYVRAQRAASLGEVLIAWRQARARVRLIIPVPGDVRGVPGPADFRAAALDAGQAVFGARIGVVPAIIEHGPSSAPPTLVWRRYEVGEPVIDHLSVPDAQHELTEAIRECASALAAANLVGSAQIGEELGDARRAGERINLPPGFPPRAVALIAQAERLSAVLALAGIDTSSAEIDAVAIQRAATLRPLIVAVRRARLAGYNAGS